MKLSRRGFQTFRQFILFAVVGAAGFLVDVIVLSIALAIGLGFYFGRTASFLSAATFTWYWNREATFRSSRAVGRRSEWLRFMLWNSIGGVANLGVYAYLIGLGGIFVHVPALAVAAGSLVGLAINYSVSKRYVFRGVSDRGQG